MVASIFNYVNRVIVPEWYRSNETRGSCGSARSWREFCSLVRREGGAGYMPNMELTPARGASAEGSRRSRAGRDEGWPEADAAAATLEVAALGVAAAGWEGSCWR